MLTPDLKLYLTPAPEGIPDAHAAFACSYRSSDRTVKSREGNALERYFHLGSSLLAERH